MALISLTTILLTLQLALTVTLGASGHLKCTPESFTSNLPPSATLEAVSRVPENGTYGEGPLVDIPHPENATNIPSLCAVTVRVQSSPSSSYRLGLFLPDHYESRFLMIGNGGFGGGIHWFDMAIGPRNGMAALSTDTGHNSSATEADWALNHPEKQIDWGWRAVHGSAELGKDIITAYYGKSPGHSYFMGCSTGGRQGLKEAQNFPETFDGVIIGAPAWWTTHLNPFLTRVGLTNLSPTSPTYISPTLFPIISQHVLFQCDALDGHIDKIISRPDLCHPDFSPLLCSSSSSSSSPCLTQSQITTLQNLYSPPTNIHPGLSPSSEPQFSSLLSNTLSPYGLGYIRDFLLNNPTFSPQDASTLDSLITLADQLNPGNASANYFEGMIDYAKRGGKVLLYHGMADGLVPMDGTILFYTKTVETLDKLGMVPEIDDWMRMFLIPGMQHCFGTPVEVGTNAPWYFEGPFQGFSLKSLPDEQTQDGNVIRQMIQWVEEGNQVDNMVARTWKDSFDPESEGKKVANISKWKGNWESTYDA
ncbi:feruloyl esterase B [Podospora fimiseda]|uniref:Carboxylic ester hydrolase n=1 Tax=Podospora fimiseda TaxID=252190 RepID=A0AAN7BNK6_9PEZI|nr:feruloyl esterase B [Podospora fimiseda]